MARVHVCRGGVGAGIGLLWGLARLGARDPRHVSRGEDVRERELTETTKAQRGSGVDVVDSWLVR
jgi:hypothetical protein